MHEKRAGAVCGCNRAFKSIAEVEADTDGGVAKEGDDTKGEALLTSGLPVRKRTSEKKSAISTF